MIRLVLLDLDDTLIKTDTQRFFTTYLQALGQHAGHLMAPGAFVEMVVSAFRDTLAMHDPARPLYPRLLDQMADRTGLPQAELSRLFESYYTHEYPRLSHMVEPRPETTGLLRWLTANGYLYVVATNPALPYAATSQRMTWGGIPPGMHPFALITTLDHMHFGKPRAEYYAEILLRLDVAPQEAIMVGDMWEDDILGAAGAGLHTYWVTEDGSTPPDPAARVDGSGSYAEFASLAQDGWLDSLHDSAPVQSALLARLRAFPAALDAERRPYSRDVLECTPGEREWSARDIICHLRDHEQIDRTRLERVMGETNPFLSAVVDPWADGLAYRAMSTEEALAAFSQQRRQTVEWLLSLLPEVWSRTARDAIFGPTTFYEIVQFLAEHDRTHLRQMRDAIAYALAVCGKYPSDYHNSRGPRKQP